MSAFHPDEKEGFLELCAITGHEFLWEGSPFTGIMRRLEPEEERYDLSPGDDDDVRITALREDFAGGLPPIGSTFTDAYGRSYRIQRFERPPNHLFLHFACSVLEA